MDAVDRIEGVKKLVQYEGREEFYGMAEAAVYILDMKKVVPDLPQVVLDQAIRVAAEDVYEVLPGSNTMTKAAIRAWLGALRSGVTEDLKRDKWGIRDLDFMEASGGHRGPLMVKELHKFFGPPLEGLSAANKPLRMVSVEGFMVGLGLADIYDTSISQPLLGFAMKLVGVNARRGIDCVEAIANVVKWKNGRNVVGDIAMFRRGLEYGGPAKG